MRSKRHFTTRCRIGLDSQSCRSAKREGGLHKRLRAIVLNDPDDFLDGVTICRRRGALWWGVP